MFKFLLNKKDGPYENLQKYMAIVTIICPSAELIWVPTQGKIHLFLGKPTQHLGR